MDERFNPEVGTPPVAVGPAEAHGGRRPIVPRIEVRCGDRNLASERESPNAFPRRGLRKLLIDPRQSPADGELLPTDSPRSSYTDTCTTCPGEPVRGTNGAPTPKG